MNSNLRKKMFFGSKKLKNKEKALAQQKMLKPKRWSKLCKIRIRA